MNLMNLPNLITLSRILLIPFFINFIVYNYNLYALGVFILAGISDALDGFIARTSKKKTSLGAILDPMADKLLLSASFLTLTITNRIPVWVSIIIISRDIIIIIGALMLILFQDRLTVLPSLIGKATTLCQIFYILLILLFLVLGKDVAVLSPVLWIMIGLTIASGVHYIYLWFKVIK
ncbi:MAG: CDP-alcohol phosphatidyltransferase family protein [Nitrospirae bacterium]|nr:CDP-alcohol phosphatidyltransferase family protein [Nitrospirota bacterium]